MAMLIDSNTKKALLKKQPCFAQLTDKEIAALSELLLERQFAANEVILKAGDPVDSVYLIANGTVDVKQADPNDSTQLKSVTTLSAGQAIGLNEKGFYSLSGERTATIIALSEVVLLRLSVATFHGFALTFPHVNEVMAQYAEKFLNMPWRTPNKQ
jgi:CRP-like cAMP-binding protein